MTVPLSVALTGSLAALVSAASALAGIVIGRRIDSRSDREQALRIRRNQSYEALAVQYFHLREALRRVAQSTVGSTHSDDQIERAREAGVDWNRAVVGVWMHGTPNSAMHARKLDHLMNDLFIASRSGESTIDEWYEMREAAQAEMDKFLDIIRVELNLPPLQIRLSDYNNR